MDDASEPLAVVQCHGCSWWWFFWEETPTVPFVCSYCKEGIAPWEPRIQTPTYGTPRPRQDTLPYGVRAKKKRKKR